MADPGEITPAIVNAIVDADLIIADLSDANPNVYYELAIAHAFAKPVIHIIEEGHKPRFDVKDVRAFPYGIAVDKADGAKIVLGEAARIATERGSQPTLVSRAAELRASATSENPVERQLVEIRELLLNPRADRDEGIMFGRRAPGVPLRTSNLKVSHATRKEIDRTNVGLQFAERDDLARWVVEFARRFGPYLDAVDGAPGAGTYLAHIWDDPDLAHELTASELSSVVHLALEQYARRTLLSEGNELPDLPVLPF